MLEGSKEPAVVKALQQRLASQESGDAADAADAASSDEEESDEDAPQALPLQVVAQLRAQLKASRSPADAQALLAGYTGLLARIPVQLDAHSTISDVQVGRRARWRVGACC